MTPELNEAEVRVLGCLIEKQITTPEYYPLTLNALTNACNQKSNRNPVLDLDEKTAVRALDGLRDRKLVWMITGASRVPKYEHNFPNAFNLGEAEVAVLCLLMLRGPQTAGEIRGRSGRLHPFETIRQVEETLDGLMTREHGPLTVKLPRQPGRKERRYAHLLAGEPEVEEEEIVPRPESPRVQVQAENERIGKLEAEVRTLREELDGLHNAFAEFKSQFE